jgi:hypothetical protein
MTNLKKLNIGCGTNILAGYVNADAVALPGVDKVFDASKGLPFNDGEFSEVLAEDFVSHLPTDLGIFMMNEFYRVLQKPNGILKLKFPEAPGITAFQDPTHISFWNFEKITYFLAGHRRREQYGIHHGVKANFKLVKQKRWINQPEKFFSTFNFNYLTNYILQLELQAL